MHLRVSSDGGLGDRTAQVELKREPLEGPAQHAALQVLVRHELARRVWDDSDAVRAVAHHHALDVAAQVGLERKPRKRSIIVWLQR